MVEDAHYIKQIKKCVSIIFLKISDGLFTPIGTGFFTSVKVDKYTSTYFVTAKHVLQDMNGAFYPKVYLRLNRKIENDAVFEELELDANPPIVLTHPDENADIAAIPLLASSDIYDIKNVPDSLFATKEIVNERVIEGDTVFFAGLFAYYPGQKKSQPILRFGKVALIPEEKIEVNKYGEPVKLADIYLFECLSIGGSSGSPVFFELGRKEKGVSIRLGPPEVYLAGIMKGHYNDIRMRKTIDLKDDILQLSHSGIAMVTPSYLLHEILFSEREVTRRQKMIKDYEAAKVNESSQTNSNQPNTTT